MAMDDIKSSLFGFIYGTTVSKFCCGEDRQFRFFWLNTLGKSLDEGPYHCFEIRFVKKCDLGSRNGQCCVHNTICFSGSVVIMRLQSYVEKL